MLIKHADLGTLELDKLSTTNLASINRSQHDVTNRTDPNEYS